MADESINIVVQDKVSSSISTKLRAIATEARSADAAIKNLQSQLAQINGGALVKVQNELLKGALNQQRLAAETQNKATVAAIQGQTAQAQLATATIRVGTAQTQGATATQRLATETQRTVTAQAQASTAAQRLATEQQRTAKETANASIASDRAAVSALKLANAQRQAHSASNAMGKDAEKLKRELYPLYDAQQAHNESVQRALALYKQGAISVKTYTDAVNASTDRLDAARRGQDAMASGLVKVGAGAKLSRHHLVNLGYQVQDIGVSLASGQNPLTVLIQQGSQIAGIAASAGVGVGSLAKAIGGLVGRFVPHLAVLGAVAGAFSLFTAEVEKDAGLDQYAKSLGYTSEQIKELDADTVTFGDTMRGLWKTINDKTGIGSAFDGLGSSAKKAFVNVLNVAVLAAQSITAMFQAAGDLISEVWVRFPGPFKKAIGDALNFGIAAFEKFGNFNIDVINKIIQDLNTISKVKITPFEHLEHLELGRISTEVAEANGKSLADTFVESYVDNLDKNKTGTSNFIADFMKNTADAAKARIRENDPNIEKNTESRATALAKVNLELDNELKRLYMLAPEREKQIKLDQIEEQLIGKKIKLSETERSSLAAKIEAVQKAADVQREMDKIYQETVGPLHEYNAALEASARLLDAGVISQERYQGSIERASEAYENAMDPMREINKQLDEEYDLLRMLPRQREVEQRLIQIQNDRLAKGMPLHGEKLEQLREELYLLQRLNEESAARDEVASFGLGETKIKNNDLLTELERPGIADQLGATGKVDAMAALGLPGYELTQEMLDAQLEQMTAHYENIDRLRQAGVVSEESALQLKQKLNADYAAAQYSLVDGTLSAIASLQNSSSKKLATLGKAAALTQATLKGYVAVQEALASGPPPYNYIAAAAVGLAATANVSKIANTPIGYMQGGYTGSIPANEVAGVVHGREYVMDAATTARLGVANLDALRNGAAQLSENSNRTASPSAQPAPQANTAGNAGGVTVDLTVVNLLDRDGLMDGYMDSERGEARVLNHINNNPSSVRQAISQ